MNTTPTLQVENLVKTYGGVQAVRGVSFDVMPQTIVGLIGPNGAGKTTTFNMIAGAEKPTEGRVWFDGTEITGKPTDQITDDCDRNYWLSADEMVEYGLADKVLSRLPVNG